METPHKNFTNNGFDIDDIIPVSALEELLLNIMTTTGLTKVAVRSSATVEQLQLVVREKLNVPTNKAVRLIFRGRVLENGNTIESYSIKNSSFVHCSISDQLSNEQQRRINRNVRERPEVLGFDRLRDYGFADTEIEQFRTQFHTHRLINSGYLNTAADLSRENLRALEEEWINNEANSSFGQNNNTSTNANANANANTNTNSNITRNSNTSQTRSRLNSISNSNTSTNANANANANAPSSSSLSLSPSLSTSSSSSSGSDSESNSNHSTHGRDIVIPIGGITNVVSSQNSNEDNSNPFGTYEDLVKGIAMGFFFNFIMLLWLPEQSLPSRTKAGVIVGFSASICFGILKLIVS